MEKVPENVCERVVVCTLGGNTLYGDCGSVRYSTPILLPRARMREAGLSNRFCPSVSRLSVVCQSSVSRKKLKSRDVHC